VTPKLHVRFHLFLKNADHRELYKQSTKFTYCLMPLPNMRESWSARRYNSDLRGPFHPNFVQGPVQTSRALCDMSTTTSSSSTPASNSFRFTAWFKSILKRTFLSYKRKWVRLPERSWQSCAISMSRRLLRPKQIHKGIFEREFSKHSFLVPRQLKRMLADV
jgi:hypothetical protein